MLVGVVVKNDKNEYLLLRKHVGKQIDLGLIGGEVGEDNLIVNIKEMLTSQVGYDFSESVDVEPLMKGEDNDGEFVILIANTNLDNRLKNGEIEFVWCSFSKIKRLYKENRINSDQYKIFKKAQEPNVKKSNNAMKVSHIEERYQKKAERFGYEDYVKRYTDKRIFLRLVRKMAVKPCGKESCLKGKLIANQFNNHKSFKNFQELMNDEDFILEIAKTSVNPAECEIYFYDYVNPHLKARAGFRLKFLKQIYLNDNVYKLEDINTIVEYLEMQKENEIILADLNFKRKIEERLNSIDYRDMVEYDCSGLSKKELRDYKIRANEKKILCENMRKGLQDILKSFTVGKEEKKEDEEVSNFYEFLCSQAKNSI